MAVCWILLAAGALAGQDTDPPPFLLSGGLEGVLVVGESSDFLDGGTGVGLGVTWLPGPGSALGLTLRARRVGLEPDRDGLTDAEARNTLYSVTMGPLLQASIGPLRPYVEGSVGFTSGRWATDAPGGEDRGTTSATTWSGAAGLRIPLSRGATPLSVKMEGRIDRVGTLSFARAPDPVDPERSTGLREHDVALIGVHLGLTLGLP